MLLGPRCPESLHYTAPSEIGAENWTMLASPIETCKLNDVNAEHWLADVPEKLVDGWPAARLGELLPWASAYTLHKPDPRLAA